MQTTMLTCIHLIFVILIWNQLSYEVQNCTCCNHTCVYNYLCVIYHSEVRCTIPSFNKVHGPYFFKFSSVLFEDHHSKVIYSIELKQSRCLHIWSNFICKLKKRMWFTPTKQYIDLFWNMGNSSWHKGKK